jgi:phage shock protein C
MHKKKIAGVCAGFADYLGVDLTLMRIIWLCAALFTGVGFIAYLVCWIVMPKEYAPAAVPANQAAHAADPQTAP